ncbi:hypothetical protein [Pseudomonas sp. B33.4]|uniref:hypothetical protein n=1 Tax=Pseudomonas sp. B33.4 TaxID=3104265 RepID=UPI002ADEC78B|nr:hypothetical protein [Pseudomonas sp. B33.4]
MKTYNGFVFNASEEHAATLKFDDLVQQNGNISKGYMDYWGLDFVVTGTYTKPTRAFTLQAKSDAKNRDELNHGPSSLTIAMKSSDGTDSYLEGTVTVKAGGQNAGQTYGIKFTKG